MCANECCMRVRVRTLSTLYRFCRLQFDDFEFNSKSFRLRHTFRVSHLFAQRMRHNNNNKKNTNNLLGESPKCLFCFRKKGEEICLFFAWRMDCVLLWLFIFASTNINACPIFIQCVRARGRKYKK